MKKGTLFKWTNYFNGWQPRYFVLSNGVLSYYHSLDDVQNSCKGSIKVSACEIIAHPTDLSRMDIIVPSEAHFYLKTPSPDDRQGWLVALGSCKVCTNSLLDNSIIPNQMVSTESGSELRLLKSKLKLCLDDLRTQVNNVKMAVKNDVNVHLLEDSTTLITVSTDSFLKCLEECFSLVNADNQSKNLIKDKQTRRLSHDNARFITKSNMAENHHHNHPQRLLSSPPTFLSSSSSPTSQANDVPLVGINNNNNKNRHNKKNNNMHKNNERNINDKNNNNIYEKDSDEVENISTYGDAGSNAEGTNDARNMKPHQTTVNGGVAGDGTEVAGSGREVAGGGREVAGSGREVVGIGREPVVDGMEEIESKPTFFSVRSFNILDDSSISTSSFLNACRQLMPIFDSLSQSSFSPAQQDMVCNINKVEEKFNSCSQVPLYSTVEGLVEGEVMNGDVDLPNSCVHALMWLLESLSFIKVLLENLVQDSIDNPQSYLSHDNTHLKLPHINTPTLGNLVEDAYHKTLKNHHGYVLQSAFVIATKKLPSKQELLHKFKNYDIKKSKDKYVDIDQNTGTNGGGGLEGGMLVVLRRHIQVYCADLAGVLDSIRGTLNKYSLKLPADQQL